MSNGWAWLPWRGVAMEGHWGGTFGVLVGNVANGEAIDLTDKMGYASKFSSTSIIIPNSLFSIPLYCTMAMKRSNSFSTRPRNLLTQLTSFSVPNTLAHACSSRKCLQADLTSLLALRIFLSSTVLILQNPGNKRKHALSK